MKKAAILLLTLFSFIACSPKEKTETEQTATRQQTLIEETAETGFDSIMAQKVGADQYGMRKYVMAFLKKGPNRNLDSAKAAELQAAHMANIGKMAEAGKLALAGPFFGNGELRGIYIFAVESLEEAEELTNSDPAIKEGSLIMELKEWYGSAALMQVNIIHKRISKIEI